LPALSAIYVLAALPLFWLLFQSGDLVQASLALPAASLLCAIWSFALVVRWLGGRWSRLLAVLARPATASIVMAVVLVLLRSHFGNQDTGAGRMLALVGLVAIGAFTYASTVFALWALTGFEDGAERALLDLLKRGVRSRRRRVERVRHAG
jgi:hypothetical protein